MGVQYGFLSSLGRASRCLAYFFCLVFPGLVFASFPAQQTYRASNPWGGPSDYYYASTRQAACNAAKDAAQVSLAHQPSWLPLSAAVIGPVNSSYSCEFYDKNGARKNSSPIIPSGGATCPSNSTLSGSVCNCNSGFEYDSQANSCVSIDESYCKSQLRWGEAMGGSGVLGVPSWYEGQRSSGVYCDDQNFNPPGGAKGCIVEFEMNWSTQVNGQWRTSGIARMMDHGPYACSPADPNLDPPKVPEKPDQPDTCKPPMVAGYVNGQVHCYTPSDKNPMETKPTTRTEREVKDNGDGTRTETTRTITTTTSCTGGSCNTVTTTTTNTQIINNSDNSVINNTTTTGENESTNPFDGFCKANPGSPLCGQGGGEDGSSWGGSCGAGFQCKGDAIQCAMARDQHLRNCQAFEPQGTEEESIYNAGKSKYGTNQTGDNPNNETIDLGFVIDQSDAIGGGTSGMSDLTVTVWNNSVTLPFSQLNQYLGWLGNLLVAVSLLLAVRIVTRG